MFSIMLYKVVLTFKNVDFPLVLYILLYKGCSNF